MLVNLEILWREIWGNFVKIALICTNHLCCNPRDSERQNWTYRWMAPQGHSYSNGNLLDWSWISIFGQFSFFWTTWYDFNNIFCGHNHPTILWSIKQTPSIDNVAKTGGISYLFEKLRTSDVGSGKTGPSVSK